MILWTSGSPGHQSHPRRRSSIFRIFPMGILVYLHNTNDIREAPCESILRTWLAREAGTLYVRLRG
jgi:hypothetical protein